MLTKEEFERRVRARKRELGVPEFKDETAPSPLSGAGSRKQEPFLLPTQPWTNYGRQRHAPEYVVEYVKSRIHPRARQDTSLGHAPRAYRDASLKRVLLTAAVCLFLIVAATIAAHIAVQRSLAPGHTPADRSPKPMPVLVEDGR